MNLIRSKIETYQKQNLTRICPIVFLLMLVSSVLITKFSKPAFGESYGSISGRVIDKATNKGLEGALIFDSAGGLKISAKTDEEGKFVINNLPAGTYKLTGYPPTDNYNYLFEKEFTEVFLNIGQNIQNVNIYLEKMGSISGRIYQSDGITPITSGNIYVYNTSYISFPKKQYSWSSINRTTGEFSIPRLFSAQDWKLIYVNTTPGNTRVYEYDSSINLINNKDFKNIKFVLGSVDSTKVFGRILNVDGDIIKKSGRVLFWYEKNRFWFNHTCLIDEDGNYSIQGDILPGEYDIRIVYTSKYMTSKSDAEYKMYNPRKIIIIQGNTKKLDLVFDSSKAERL